MAPHSPCQCHEKCDRRSETDPRSRQCHRDGIPGKATNSEKQKKKKRGEKGGGEKNEKSESELTKTKRVARSNPKKGKTVKLCSDHEEPRKRGGKTKSKTKANRRKDNSKKTKVVRRMTIGWTMTDSKNETQRSEKQSDGLRPTDSSRDIDQVGQPLLGYGLLNSLVGGGNVTTPLAHQVGCLSRHSSH